MKKQLIILSALSVFGSPWALATGSGITTSALAPPVKKAAPAAAELKINISGVLNEGQVEKLVEASPSADVQTKPFSAGVIRSYKYIKHVDLRDVTKYDKQIAKKLPNSDDRLPGTSRKILQAVLEDPARFAGLVDNVVYYENGAKGPSGSASFVSERSRKEFVISKRYPETQTNTIFSVDYISAVEVAPSVIDAKLLLFIHSDVSGHFFRKLTVRVDWKKNRTHALSDVVSILSVDAPMIPLSSTDFKMKGSLSAQKIILEDKENDITKVFPVTVGAIDARSESVESMTFWVPERPRRSAKRNGLEPELQDEFQDFSNAAMVKRSYWSAGFNIAERNYPSYYKGRPFIALIDMNYVTEEPNFSAGYREIGLHYQIKSSLERGFKSHGCVRVIDKDLYQLDAIVNHGPKDKVESVFKKRLPEYEGINHPHPYKSTYSKVGYTNYPSVVENGNVKCKATRIGKFKSRRVRWNSSNQEFNTIIDGDCLTKVYKTDKPSTEVSDFWAEKPGATVDVHVVNAEHSPVTNAKNKLNQYGYNSWDVDAMTHAERLEELYRIKIGEVYVDPLLLNPPAEGEQTTGSRWPSYGINASNIISSVNADSIAYRINNGLHVNANRRRKYYQRIYFVYCVQPSTPSQYENSCSIFQREAVR